MKKLAQDIYKLAQSVESDKTSAKQKADSMTIGALTKLNGSLLSLDKIVRGDEKAQAIYKKLEEVASDLFNRMAEIYDIDLEKI